MADVKFSVSIEGLESLGRKWNKARRVLSDGIYISVEKATEAGAEEALRTRRWKNRTGEAERKTTGAVTKADETSAEGEIVCDVPYASYLSDGTRPHDIKPRNASVLSWEGNDGEQAFATIVHHPGTKPDPFMQKAEQKARVVLEKELEKAAARAAEIMNK